MGWEFAITITFDGLTNPWDPFADRQRAYRWVTKRSEKALVFASRKLFGPRWNERGKTPLKAVGFAQKPSAYPHVHIAATANGKVTRDQLEKALLDAMAKLCPGANVDVQIYTGPYWIAYCGKEWSLHQYLNRTKGFDDAFFVFAR